MIAYKGFRPGMICIGYQFQMGLNVTERPTAAKMDSIVRRTLWTA